MNKNERTPPCLFRQQDAGFEPTKLARNPWFDNAVAGGPVCALIACAIEDHLPLEDMEISRLTVDILGVVPSTMLVPRVSPIRVGRQAQLHRIELLAGEKVVAHAQVLLARHMETPEFHPPSPYPDPDGVEEDSVLIGASMAGSIRTRPVQGGVRQPGRGIVWLSMSGDVIEGRPASAFTKSCLFADFGNGIGSSTRHDEWSFANLDVSVNFLRMPRGDWFLVDAHTEGCGNGHALAQSVFADREGVFAKGTQTIFVAPSTRTD